MKSTGIVRNIDELGRVVIPKEMRRNMGISSTDPFEIYVEDGKIILERFEPSCHFCGSTAECTTEFKGKMICSVCLSEIKAI